MFSRQNTLGIPDKYPGTWVSWSTVCGYPRGYTRVWALYCQPWAKSHKYLVHKVLDKSTVNISRKSLYHASLSSSNTRPHQYHAKQSDYTAVWDFSCFITVDFYVSGTEVRNSIITWRLRLRKVRLYHAHVSGKPHARTHPGLTKSGGAPPQIVPTVVDQSFSRGEVKLYTNIVKAALIVIYLPLSYT